MTNMIPSEIDVLHIESNGTLTHCTVLASDGTYMTVSGAPLTPAGHAELRGWGELDGKAVLLRDSYGYDYGYVAGGSE